MSLITFKNVNFHYDVSYHPVFENLNFTLETNWKTGIIAKNGTGKSTLLQLIHKQYEPTNGEITSSVETKLYPLNIKSDTITTIDLIKQHLGLLNIEAQLQTPENFSEEDYLNLLLTYTDLGGYELDYKLDIECQKLHVDTSCLNRPFHTLSGGEQTKIQIIVLFLQTDNFILLDEPTNHLDTFGIELLANYLNTKSGFIVISHHRDFLNMCCDHLLYINKGTVTIEQGNYDSFAHNLKLRKEHEANTREKITKEVHQLEKAATQRRVFADRKEKQKIGAGDKGRVGHLAARSMKRAKNIERRINTQLEHKKELLTYTEWEPYIKFSQEKATYTLLTVTHLTLGYDQPLIKDLSFTLEPGQRLAITGPNGCGKSTLLKALRHEIEPLSGHFKFDNRVIISYASQLPTYTHGMLQQHLRELQLDETRFRSILGTLGCSRVIFERDLSTFSLGELKKVDIALSLLTPATLLIWDEPLNGLDIATREAIEIAILVEQPTMIIVEHDTRFINTIATHQIHL